MTAMPHGLSRYDYLIKQCLDQKTHLRDEPLAQQFGYLLGKANDITGNLKPEAIVKAFIELVDDMETNDVGTGPADAGMTFLGQFVDHDITLEATSVIGKKIDPRSIRNVRTPNLDLDCVYGDGPEATPHLYHPKHKGFLLFGREDNPYDLARNCKGTALIGDPRNDENIIVSQVQGAWIALHNCLMSHVTEGGSAKDDVHDCGTMLIRRDVWSDYVVPHLEDFEHVRRFVRLHYQWIVLHELLPAFVDQSCIDHALHDPYVFGRRSPIMPAEFAGAAYRFGHATVQAKYTLRDGVDRDLFTMHGFQPRRKSDQMDMKHFFSTPDHAAQPALSIGTKMASTLFRLPDNIVSSGEEWGGVKVDVKDAKKLGLRNILRDRTALKLASGQQVARWLDRNASHLKVRELPAHKTLKKHHIDKTPLWFYCLEEAEKTGGKLSGVGGTIVASVMVRLLKEDPESVLNTNFAPWKGFGGKQMTMGKLMAWVEKNRGDVAHQTDLFCGPAPKD